MFFPIQDIKFFERVLDTQIENQQLKSKISTMTHQHKREIEDMKYQHLHELKNLGAGIPHEETTPDTLIQSAQAEFQRYKAGGDDAAGIRAIQHLLDGVQMLAADVRILRG